MASMTIDRRITEDTEREPLKKIAGLIQRLSFRDMQELTRQIDPHASDQEQRELAEQILTGTDRILGHAK